MKDEKNSKLSIMIIPKTRKVKRITIPNWLPKSILICIAIISIFFIFTFDKKANVNSNLEKNNMEQERQIAELQNRIQELKYINKEKDSQVAKLQQRNAELDNKAKEVEIKLEQIDKLKKQLENMANK